MMTFKAKLLGSTAALALGLLVVGVLSESWATPPKTEAVAAAADPLGRDVPVPQSYFGMHFHRATAGTVWPDVGIAGWRLWDSYTGWRQLQPQKETWDFGMLDRSLELAQKQRVEPLLVFGITPAWASARPEEKGAYGPGSASEPRSMDDWRTLMRAVAARYRGRINLYEVWNEPDLKQFYTGKPEVMAEMTKIACTELKAADPGIMVLGPSPSSGSQYAIEWYRKYIKALGADVCFDVMAWHFYTQHAGPEQVVESVAKVQALARELGIRPMPIWNTEAGYFIDNDVGPEVARMADGNPRKVLTRVQAANYLARGMLLAWASGVDRYYWYAWDNTNMGLVNSDHKPKLAGEAYRSLAQWMVGSTITDCRRSDGIWTCQFARRGRTAFVVWAEQGQRAWEIPAAWNIRSAQDLQGVQASITGSKMSIGESPVLLKGEPVKW